MARKFEKKLPPKQERKFRAAFKKIATTKKTNPDPDDPRHFYDHRAAFKAGQMGSATQHGSSKFKREGHPRMILPKPPFRHGINTKTGRPATAAGVRKNKAARTSVKADIAKARAKR